MTNDLFLEYLDGEIIVHKQPAPIRLEKWQVQALRNIFRAAAFQEFIEPLVDAGIFTLPRPTEPRDRVLAAKAARGKGPPSSASWRGNERNTKYRSQ